MPITPPTDRRRIEALLEIMAALRSPDGGCPWDLEQDFASIAPYTIEEAYEVADAIRRGEMGELKEELGDLLLQVVYHAQMASEDGSFTFADVVEAISSKMIRRHPHVFGDAEINDAASQTANWEDIKAAERAAKAKDSPQAPESVLDGVPLALPALTRAEKLAKRAARVGFDWNDDGGIFAKLEEETEEFREAAASGDETHMREELGDLLFVVVNLARRHGIDPEQALMDANAKFTGRFHEMERQVRESDLDFANLDISALEILWQSAKNRAR